MPVVVCSGGMDSMVLCHAAVEFPEVYGLPHGERVVALFGDFGQCSADECCGLIQETFELVRVRIPVPDSLMSRLGSHTPGYLPEKSGSATVLLNDDPKENEAALASKDYSYIPCRSTLLLSFGVMHASALGLSQVWTGFQFEPEEWEAFDAGEMAGDIDPSFLAEFQNLLDSGGYAQSQGRVIVRAPFLEGRASKATIAALGRKLGVDLTKTYSCEYSPPCGVCWQCVRANKVKVRDEQ